MYSEVSATAFTLADVMRVLNDRHDLSPTRRRDLLSALNRFASLTVTPLEAHPIDFRKLRAAFISITPTHAVSGKSLANIRSDLKKAVALSRLRPALGTDARRALSSEWKRLWEPLSEKRLRVGLSRFLKFCSARNIGPDEVSDDVLGAFFDDMENNTLARKILELRRDIPGLWNRACDQAPNWPQRRLTVPPSRRIEKNIPFSKLPPGFAQSISELLAWCGHGDPFEPAARATPMAPTTRANIKQSLRLAANAAVLAGIPLDQLDHISRLIEPQTMGAILRQLNQEAGGKPSGRALQAANSLITVGEYMGRTKEQIGALKKIKSGLPRGHGGLTARNRALLRNFDDEDLKRRLATLPALLWARANGGKLAKRAALIEAQNAILIQFLLLAPLRLKNLVALRFGENLSWPGGKSGPLMLYVDGQAVKNSRDFQAVLSDPLASMLWRYREQIVPWAVGRKCDAVLITSVGKRKAPSSVRIQFIKALRKGLGGLRLTPHQMRHVVAKLLLDANPGAHELVRELLGHHSIETTIQYYAGIDTNRAVRHHDKVIKGLREAAAASSRKS